MIRLLPSALARRTLIAVLVLVALPAAPAAAQDTAQLGPGSATFPERAVRLMLPKSVPLAADQLAVTENGEPVEALELTSSTQTRTRRFGTMIVLDASKSMRGSAILEAVRAARVLVRERAASQRIGIVTFNDGPAIRLELTDDAQAISTALAKPPPLAAQTHIFDAVGLALDHLKQQRIDAGTIVVLSDGSDTGSTMSLATAARRARQEGVRLYTVGLRSGAFNQSELQSLASAGQGRYSAAASIRDLRTIFRNLGSQLASEYLVRYRSTASPGSTVRIAVRVDGLPGVATSRYRVPGNASFVLVEDNFWTSTLGLLSAAALCALLLALALGGVLLRRIKGPDVRARVKSFVFPTIDDLTRSPATRQEPRALNGAERSLEKMRWWVEFKHDLEIARIEVPAMRIATLTALGTLVTMYLLVAISGAALLGVTAFAIPFMVRSFVRIKRDRQRNLFADQLPDMLQGTASAIRAGHGFVSALAIVVEDAPEPSSREFQRVVADEQLGVPLDEALAVVQRRMDSRDVQQVALVAQIQREAGGNSAEVLDRVTEAVRQRAELRRMVRGLTAQGRLSRWVVTALPVALLVIISLMNPDYMQPLFNTGTGRMLLVAAAVGVTAGSLVIKKIVDFKV